MVFNNDIIINYYLFFIEWLQDSDVLTKDKNSNNNGK